MPIVTGDTKVVEQGKGDGVFISTTGIGVAPSGLTIDGRQARVGDAVLVSGTLGEHGVAVMSLRESLEFETAIVSDSAAPAHPGAGHAAGAARPALLRVLRDPTRGGLASTLNEITRQSQVGMLLREADIPVLPQVAAACELLGLDPLYVANEGKLVAICAPEAAEPCWPPCARTRWARGTAHRHRGRGRQRLCADGHALWRPPRGGLAQRRAVAAHLLNPPCASCCSPTVSTA